MSRRGLGTGYRTEAPLMTPSRLRRVLYVGQLAFFKAPMIVAGVMRRLAERRPELEFTWVTKERDHDEVRSLLGEETGRRVRLLGWMPQDQLIRVYDDHGLFLFPSFFEGFGKVFLEAMSRGVCVVAADNGGARDVLRTGMNGILVPTGDMDAMEVACMSLLDNPERAATISEAAARAARAHTWRSAAERTAESMRGC